MEKRSGSENAMIFWLGGELSASHEGFCHVALAKWPFKNTCDFLETNSILLAVNVNW